MSKLVNYLEEADANSMYWKMARKNYKELQRGVKKLDGAFKKDDVIELRSACRTIESSAKRINEYVSLINF